MTPNWTWTLNSQSTLYTKASPAEAQILSVSLYNQQFPRYRTFQNFPLTTMLNIEKKKKNLPKIQILKFYNFLYNFGRDPS